MPTSIKIPTPSAAPKGPEPEAPPLVGSEPGPLLSYTLGRLRPRFIDLGAWHELGSLIPEPPPRPGTDDLERVIKRVFAPDGAGRRPASFYLARELVWPLQDAFGVSQCLVVPRSDEQIAELLEALCPPSAQCSTCTQCIVHGAFMGHCMLSVPELAGIPMVELVSVAAFETERELRVGSADERARLFRAFQPILANNGVGNELRAVNYVLTRSNAFYELAGQLDERGEDKGKAYRLMGMSTLEVQGPPAKPVLEVVFSFGHVEGGGVRRWSQRVDVGGPFMFFATEEVHPFYARPIGAVQPQGAGGVEPQQEAQGLVTERRAIASGSSAAGSSPERGAIASMSSAAGSSPERSAVASEASAVGSSPEALVSEPAPSAPAPAPEPGSAPHDPAS